MAWNSRSSSASSSLVAVIALLKAGLDIFRELPTVALEVVFIVQKGLVAQSRASEGFAFI